MTQMDALNLQEDNQRLKAIVAAYPLQAKQVLDANKELEDENRNLESQLSQKEKELELSHLIIENMRKWICDHTPCVNCPVFHVNENQCDNLIDYFLPKPKEDEK